MSPALHIQLLGRTPLFHGIRAEVLGLLLADTPPLRKAAGEHFFRQGDDALYMYLLVSGQVSVSKTGPQGEVELARLGPGDCFGEVALIDLHPRSASVRALADCTALEISSVHLYRVHEVDIEQFIAIQANIARELCRRLRLADARWPATQAEGSGPGSAGELAWPTLLTL